MALPRKLRRAISDPDAVGPYVRKHRSVVEHMLANRRPFEALLYAVDRVSDTNLYRRYLQHEADDGLVRRRVNDYEMYLPVDDEGVSRKLRLHGVHEPESTAVFREELERLARERATVTVLEAGANIGYYCLLELQALGEQARMIAVEPEPRNANVLRENLDLNGHGDVPIHRLALSDDAGREHLFLSPSSNWHRLGEPHFSADGRRIEVDTCRGDDLVRNEGLEPGDVNVVRMDVEGHEPQVMAGIRDVLSADGPLLAFVEIHHAVDERGELDAVLRPLVDNDFRLVNCYNSKGIDVPRVSDLYDFPFGKWCNPQLICRRG